MDVFKLSETMDHIKIEFWSATHGQIIIRKNGLNTGMLRKDIFRVVDSLIDQDLYLAELYDGNDTDTEKMAKITRQYRMRILRKFVSKYAENVETGLDLLENLAMTD